MYAACHFKDIKNSLHIFCLLRRLFVCLPVTRAFVYSGSSNALWFSSKFERKMAAFDEESPASPMTRFQRAVPIRESKFVGGKYELYSIFIHVSL